MQQDFGVRAAGNAAAPATGADAAAGERSLPQAAAHSGGEWHYGEWAAVRDPAGEIICDVRLYKQNGVSHRDAHGRLIAAAPDLLEALIACRNELSALRNGSIGGIPNSIVALIPERIEQANAAIRKATEAPVMEGEWIEWNGGDAPVSDTTRVAVRFRNGTLNSARLRASSWEWSHVGYDYDIVAYRVEPAAEVL